MMLKSIKQTKLAEKKIVTLDESLIGWLVSSSSSKLSEDKSSVHDGSQDEDESPRPGVSTVDDDSGRLLLGLLYSVQYNTIGSFQQVISCKTPIVFTFVYKMKLYQNTSLISNLRC